MKIRNVRGADYGQTGLEKIKSLGCAKSIPKREETAATLPQPFTGGQYKTSL